MSLNWTGLLGLSYHDPEPIRYGAPNRADYESGSTRFSPSFFHSERRKPYSVTFLPRVLSRSALPPKMLARFLTRPSNLRLLSIAAGSVHSNPPPPRPRLATLLRRFSADRGSGDGNGGDSRDPSLSDPWKLSGDGDAKFDRFFSVDSGGPGAISGGTADYRGGNEEDSWLKEGEAGEKGVGGDNGWLTAEGYRPWSLSEEGKDEGLFDIGEGTQAIGDDLGRGADGPKTDSSEEKERLEKEEQELTTVLKGSQF